ncbi:flagellar protein FliO/FliZ [Extensimonas vulgaris]|uniref:Flagellar protein FliO/FliZ n=2 Tax=Extensimonas vulgaris TaxID=1031594 RepID=A0A369AQK5_9BURK|nr:flagellar protein FliO/FliZ [Extensimonas vulgaris]TWI41260.1 flagellar protein FliO/FliZ [Extensimonas vulgaris]
MANMSQPLALLLLFVGALALLPWLVRRLQQRRLAHVGAAGAGVRVLSAVAVGPQQRVLTVEVGPEGARSWLVLGVTAQHINCLHVLQPGAETQAKSGTTPLACALDTPASAPAAAASFAQTLAQTQPAPGKGGHG